MRPRGRLDYTLREEQCVVADVGANIDDRHTGPNRGGNNVHDFGFPSAVHKASEAVPIDRHPVAFERALAVIRACDWNRFRSFVYGTWNPKS